MPETLYLIDGHAQIFRAFFAIRGGMRSPVTGEPTHAIFGFTQMLLKLFSQFHPHYVAVAVDMPGKTFRDDMYADYKATRQPTPPDLTSQVPRILELIKLFGIPVVGVEGLEADDLIATLACRVVDDPAAKDVNIRIVSRDKDLEQLLSDRVSMFDIHTDTTMDVARLKEEKGITPAQVVDVLALIGDAVDNVPGVDGIGPKTAAQLIQEFGSIDGLLANLDKLKGKRRENIEKGRDLLALSRQLVKLKCDATFDFTLESARVKPIAAQNLIPLFQQLGFNRFQDEVRRLAGSPPPADDLFAAASAAAAPAEAAAASDAPPSETASLFDHAQAQAAAEEAYAPDTTDYRAITTAGELAELAATLRAQSLFSVDTETTGLGRDCLLCGVSFSWQKGQGVYVPVRSPAGQTHLDEATVLAALKPALEDASLKKCGHNLKFDAGMLLRCGVKLRGAVFDSMLASALIDPSQQSHRLDHLASRCLKYRMIPIQDLIGAGEEQAVMDTVPLEKIVPYAAEDADIALRLCHELSPKLDGMGMGALLREVESPLAVVIAEMENNGIMCDPAELDRQGELLSARVAELRKEICDIVGCEFVIDSPKQLAEVLFDKLGLASLKKTKTGRSTDIQVLEKLAAEENRNDPRTSVPRLIIEYRQLTKLINTYLGNLKEAINPATRRIHSTFHQLLTATGRLASHAPNLQNIPIRSDVGRQIRKAFVAAPGNVLICADYSQIELRILAHLSDDPALLDAFARDQDIHTAVAAQVFGVPLEQVSREQRGYAKTINFGIIYGVTAYGLARRIEGLDAKSAATLIADYKKRFAGIDRFLNRCVQQAMDVGYVTTILGRRRNIPEVHSTNAHTRNLGERLAINSVVQGSAADLIKVAMVQVQQRIDREQLPMKLLLQIHDELVLESPADLAERHSAIVREEMERAMTLQAPLKASAGAGADWYSAK